MDIDEKNKKLEQLMERNKDIFGKFISELPKVELGVYHKTFKEKYDLEEELIKSQTFISDDILKQPAIGLSAFLIYGEMVIDCINNVALNEERNDVIFKEEEIIEHTKWLERMKQIKDGDLWIYFYESLFSCIIPTHDARVNKMREHK